MMMAIIAATSIPAVAQWISLGHDNDKKVFTDLKTVHRAGKTVRIWSLSDFEKEQEIDGERFLSQEIRHAAKL